MSATQRLLCCSLAGCRSSAPSPPPEGALGRSASAPPLGPQRNFSTGTPAMLSAPPISDGSCRQGALGMSALEASTVPVATDACNSLRGLRVAAAAPKPRDRGSLESIFDSSIRSPRRSCEPRARLPATPSFSLLAPNMSSPMSLASTSSLSSKLPPPSSATWRPPPSMPWGACARASGAVRYLCRAAHARARCELESALGS